MVTFLNSSDLKGVVTSLDADGHLSCSYLGTDPSLFVVPTPESREINYDEQDEEMKLLQQTIRESSQSAGIKRERKLQISFAQFSLIFWILHSFHSY